MVSPEHKRRAVASVVETSLCSLRRACRYLGLGRSSYYYRALAKEDYERQLVNRVKELSKENPTYGYRFITVLLRREGWRVNRKKVQRLRRAEGLRGHIAVKKKTLRGASSAPRPVEAHKPNDVWSWDFIFDTTEEGRSIKILSVVDEATRFCVDLNVNRTINAKQVRTAMDQACLRYGQPRCIRSDNGPEFIASAIREWIESRKIDCIFIEPGSPWQNPYVESFHSRFRNDCLNREWFINELDARVSIADWREKYNERRPHSGIDYKSPAELYLGKGSGSGQATPSLHRSPCQNPNQSLTIKI
ncbi:MAG: IS3 family transposase [Verrucomicrobiota bacterium]